LGDPKGNDPNHYWKIAMAIIGGLVGYKLYDTMFGNNQTEEITYQ
jgi:hypothetical protein